MAGQAGQTRISSAFPDEKQKGSISGKKGIAKSSFESEGEFAECFLPGLDPFSVSSGN